MESRRFLLARPAQQVQIHYFRYKAYSGEQEKQCLEQRLTAATYEAQPSGIRANRYRGGLIFSRDVTGSMFCGGPGLALRRACRWRTQIVQGQANKCPVNDLGPNHARRRALTRSSSRNAWTKAEDFPRHNAPTRTGSNWPAGNGSARTFGASSAFGTSTESPIPNPLPT